MSTTRPPGPAAFSESHYRALFESIDLGLCVIELIFDADGRAVDYVFLEVNPAFTDHTGLKNVVGRRIRELVPAIEERWFRIFGDVARTGVPIRFEQEAAALGRWYSVYAFRVDDPSQRHVAVLFRDISEQKRTEEALRRSEAAQARARAHRRSGEP